MRFAGGFSQWFKWGVICLLVCALILAGILYWAGGALLESALGPRLKLRAGTLEGASVRLNLSGVHVEVDRYEEAGLWLEDLRVMLPWSGLLGSPSRFVAGVEVGHLWLQIPLDSSGGEDAEAVSRAAVVARLAEQIASLPIAMADIEVEQVDIEHAGQTVELQAECSMLRGANGEVHLSASIGAEVVVFEARAKVPLDGSELAVDFVASLTDWTRFQELYMSDWASRLAQEQTEIYIDSLDAGRGFLEFSGYARWSADAADQLSLTALADIGALECYWPQGEVLLQSASLGLANDASGQLRAYGKGAIDQLRANSWSESEGAWALRLEGSKLVGELRVGQSLQLSLAHDDWRQLLVGSGVGRFYLKSDSVDAELLRVLELPVLPADLEFEMAVRVEGEGMLEAWQLADVQGEVQATVREARVASAGLSLTQAEVRAELQATTGALAAAELAIQVESFDVLGFALNQVKLGMTTGADGVIELEPITANLMGGRARIEAMRIDPETQGELNCRLRLEAIDLKQLAAAVPQFQGEITGEVSGYLEGALRGGQPVLTDGHLEIDSESGARLSYDVNGLLTRGMVAGSPAYLQYRMAERAFEDLALKQFRIDVFPEGNATRPFRLKLFGESLQGTTVVPVDFSLNVNVDDTAGLLELLRMIQRGELDFN